MCAHYFYYFMHIVMIISKHACNGSLTYTDAVDAVVVPLFGLVAFVRAN